MVGLNERVCIIEADLEQPRRGILSWSKLALEART